MFLGCYHWYHIDSVGGHAVVKSAVSLSESVLGSFFSFLNYTALQEGKGRNWDNTPCPLTTPLSLVL